jgi:hypothetical protein
MDCVDPLGKLCIERDLLVFPGSAGKQAVPQMNREPLF